jgi:hypothetical protein
MKVAAPMCPKCGCPARYVIGTFKVRVEVDIHMDPTGRKFVGKPVGDDPKMLECSGGHTWESKVGE